MREKHITKFAIISLKIDDVDLPYDQSLNPSSDRLKYFLVFLLYVLLLSLNVLFQARKHSYQDCFYWVKKKVGNHDSQLVGNNDWQACEPNAVDHDVPNSQKFRWQHLIPIRLELRRADLL